MAELGHGDITLIGRLKKGPDCLAVNAKDIGQP